MTVGARLELAMTRIIDLEQFRPSRRNCPDFFYLRAVYHATLLVGPLPNEDSRVAFHFYKLFRRTRQRLAAEGIKHPKEIFERNCFDALQTLDNSLPFIAGSEYPTNVTDAELRRMAAFPIPPDPSYSLHSHTDDDPDPHQPAA